MGTFNVELSGRLKPPHGIGPRAIIGKLIIGPVSEAVHAKDLELRTIHSLKLIDQIGTISGVAIVKPGTFDNYASVTFWRAIVGGGGTLTRQVIVSGSKTWYYEAYGE